VPSRLVVVLCTLAFLGFSHADEPRPDITYADGRVSADLRDVPLDQVLAALEEETGAAIRGDIRDWRDVTKRFDGIPLHEALDRLLGKQNFVVVYDDAGHPARIVLLGMPQPRPVADPRAVQRSVAQLLAAHPPLTLPPRLGAALRAPRATLPRLFSAAARQRDPAARAEARRLLLRALHDDAALRKAMQRLDAGGLVDVVRRWVGTARTREFLTGMTAEAVDPILRVRAATALRALEPARPSEARPATPAAGRPHATRRLRRTLRTV
jgi:hypothetical protein